MSFMIGNLYYRVVFCNFDQDYFMQKGSLMLLSIKDTCTTS